jgi:transcriptional regulator with PAS, ATPase and Fis domain
MNCGALTESLIEAELFGYVKGAFTGAVRDKKGCFELAHGGSLFLDEIGEMSPVMQVKLLRVIQERKVVRVGGEAEIPVDIRLICATHQDLKKMVEEGRFREDLYYRINVVPVHIPALRERSDDILWLARRFLETWAQEDGDRRILHRSAEQALAAYPWPGNVRELKNCLERGRTLSRDTLLTAQHLFGKEATALSARRDESAASLNEYLQRCERRYIEEGLRAHDGQITHTANALGISRKNLWEKMKKLGITS